MGEYAGGGGGDSGVIDHLLSFNWAGDHIYWIAGGIALLVFLTVRRKR